MDASIRGPGEAAADGAATSPPDGPLPSDAGKPAQRSVIRAVLGALSDLSATSAGSRARRAELARPEEPIPFIPTRGGRLLLPAAYASPVSMTKAPLESTGRITTSDLDWKTWFAARDARGTERFMCEIAYPGPGFQHDDRHFAGVGRGLGANVMAYCDERRKPLPGRFETLDIDFYDAVGFRHDAHRFRDAKPPSVPETLRDYSHFAESAHFDPFEHSVAEILTAATAHHESERARAKWHERLAAAVKAGEVSREEAPAIVMLCKLIAVVDQCEIVATARSFYESYVRRSVLMAEWGERDDKPIAGIEPAQSAHMCGPEFYDSIGSPAWHAEPWAGQIQWLATEGVIDAAALREEFKLPDVETIRDRIPTEGPGYRAIYAGSVAVFDAFNVDSTLTHEALLEIGTLATEANLIERGRARLVQMPAGDTHRTGLAMLLGAMARENANPLSEARLRMQVLMADLLGDEAVMLGTTSPRMPPGVRTPAIKAVLL